MPQLPARSDRTTDTRKAPEHALARRLLGGLLMTVMACELIARGTALEQAGQLSWLALGGVVILALPRIGLREIYLLSFCALMVGLLLWQRDTPVPTLVAGLNQATFLVAFVLLLGLLQEAASTSPSVEMVGRYVSQQPAGRRFYALYSGTGGMAVLFNIGVVSFLVPLIQRGIRTSRPGEPMNPVRERRQISAVTRGFAWSVIWSPTAIAPLALMTLLPDIDRGRWILMGAVIFVILMFVGALEDRNRFRSLRPAEHQPHPQVPRSAISMFALSCLWLFLLSRLISWLLGETMIFGLLAACPLMLISWLAVQNAGPAATVNWAAVGTRLNTIAFTNLPNSSRLAVTLGCSGFIGQTAAALVSAEAISDTLGLTAVPDYLLLSAMPPLIALISFSGLSPIMTSVFFGSFFGSLPIQPADPTLMALAISMGWALSMTVSPFATVILIVNRVSGYPAATLSYGWNATFGALCIGLSIPIFALLVQITGGS